MKKIITIVTLILISQGMLMAQKAKPVSEDKVDSKYVKDFQKKAPGAKDVKWEQKDNIYTVSFTSEDNERQSIIFSPKGTETHFYIESDYYPKFIQDFINQSSQYKGYSISEVYALKTTKSISYQARIVKKSGILWWKKVSHKLVNFSIDGAFIDAYDEVSGEKESAAANKEAVGAKK